MYAFQLQEVSDPYFINKQVYLINLLMQPFHFENWYNVAPIFEKCHYGQFVLCTVYKYPFSQLMSPY